MKIYIFLLSIVLVWSCTSKGKSDTEKFNYNKTNSEINTPTSSIPNAQVDSIRDYNNFYISENFYELTEINNKFMDDPETDVFNSSVFSWGDCSARYKKLLSGNAELYVFKSDCGEYGFGNDQFYFVNDSIIMVRNFNVQISEWQTDSTKNKWSISEKIFIFNDNEATTLMRDRITENYENNKMAGISYSQNHENANVWLQEKRKEFDELMGFAVSSED